MNAISKARKSIKQILLMLFVLSAPIQHSAFAMASRPADPNAPPPPAWVQFFPMLVMVAVFYLLLIRPQIKQRKDRDSMINSLKKGDRVVTQGGVFATIVNINTDSIEVKVNEETKIRIRKSAISEVLAPEGSVEAVGAGK